MILGYEKGFHLSHPLLFYHLLILRKPAALGRGPCGKKLRQIFAKRPERNLGPLCSTAHEKLRNPANSPSSERGS